MRRKITGVAHPMEAYGTRRGWVQERTAAHFEVGYGRYRQIVTGHTGASFATAQAWARRSGSEFTALDVMLWHQEYQRPRRAG